MMIYSTYTWDLVQALESASPAPARHQPHLLIPSALCQASMFSSHEHASSMRITLFSLLGKIVMSGLSSVKAV